MTSYVNIFEDMDFMMNLLAGAYDDKIKKGKMKIEPVYSKKQIDLGDTVLTEATLDEVIVPTDELEFIEVETIEEVMGIESVIVIDEDYDEEEQVSAPKCTDIEKAISVLDGSCTDMDSEDFEPEVWAEANELYYSMDDVGRTEEIMATGETIITMSGNRLIDFLVDRANSIELWNEEDDGNVNDEYIYEEDEVNVVEECDVTIFSFAKAFSCMMPRVA